MDSHRFPLSTPRKRRGGDIYPLKDLNAVYDVEMQRHELEILLRNQIDALTSSDEESVRWWVNETRGIQRLLNLNDIALDFLIVRSLRCSEVSRTYERLTKRNERTPIEALDYIEGLYVRMMEVDGTILTDTLMKNKWAYNVDPVTWLHDNVKIISEIENVTSVEDMQMETVIRYIETLFPDDVQVDFKKQKFHSLRDITEWMKEKQVDHDREKYKHLCFSVPKRSSKGLKRIGSPKTKRHKKSMLLSDNKENAMVLTPKEKKRVVDWLTPPNHYKDVVEPIRDYFLQVEQAENDDNSFTQDIDDIIAPFPIADFLSKLSCHWEDIKRRRVEIDELKKLRFNIGSISDSEFRNALDLLNCFGLDWVGGTNVPIWDIEMKPVLSSRHKIPCKQCSTPFDHEQHYFYCNNDETERKSRSNKYKICRKCVHLLAAILFGNSTENWCLFVKYISLWIRHNSGTKEKTPIGKDVNPVHAPWNWVFELFPTENRQYPINFNMTI